LKTRNKKTAPIWETNQMTLQSLQRFRIMQTRPALLLEAAPGEK